MSSPGSRNVKRGVALERRIAKLLGGRRFWVSSGERIDVESPHFLVQTKNVKKMPLPELVRLAEEMEGWANTNRSDPTGSNWKHKVGMVAVQLAHNHPPPHPPVIFILTQSQLLKLFEKMNFYPGTGFYEDDKPS